MAKQVVNGATLQCSFGTTPSNLVVLPTEHFVVDNMPAATIMDHQPMINIMPFGMCQSMANPAVASATAAAFGVLTPQPCVPVTMTPWAPGLPTDIIGNKLALTSTCRCMCNWGGIISITNPGSTTMNVP